MDMDFVKSVVLPYINFAIFLVLLIKFGKKPLAQALGARKDAFLASSSQAKQLHDEAKLLNEKLQSRLDNLSSELSEIAETIINTAKSESDRIISEAERLSLAIKTEAELLIQSELAQAEQKIHNDLVAQAAKAVEEKLKSGLAAEANSALVTSGINKIRSMNL